MRATIPRCARSARLPLASQYGYSRFWAVNATHWHLEQVQTSVPGGPKLWEYAVDIYQPAHGAFA